ncbi:MAG: hypothetical protein MMC33_002178 [Icmadophila ericetorum]|nr:hypothetical protein [Icmadophila ericetorum]
MYGIYIRKDGKRIADNLAATIAEDEYHEWTEDEANEQLKISKHFHSLWNPNTDEYRMPAPRFSRINPQQTVRQPPQNIRINPQQTVQQVPQHLPEPNPQNQFQYVYGQDQPTGQTPPSDPAIDTPPETLYRTKTTLPGGAVQQQSQTLPDVPSKSLTDLMKISVGSTGVITVILLVLQWSMDVVD